MANIHPTAIVEDGARLGADVRVGPFCSVGAEVELEDGVELVSHVVVTGRTRIGARTVVHPFSLIGGAPQDLGYKGEQTGVTVGPDCVLRENTTIHRGTAKGRGETVIGRKNFLMIGSHVAHDCIVGDNVIFTNHATLGGHSIVGDHAILAGLCAVQQRTRIGAHAFIGGLTGVTSDVIPFGMAIGNRAFLAGLNIVGLRRRGFDRPTLHALRDAYRDMFFGSGTRAERIDRIARRHDGIAAVGEMVAFLRDAGNRRLCLPRAKSAGARIIEAEEETADA